MASRTRPESGQPETGQPESGQPETGHPSAGPGKPRRTQAERKHATITAILEATIDAIAEAGYARTTIQEIVTRAGVSQGALFRHFPTRLDVIVDAAEEVGARQVREFLRILDSSPAPVNAARLLGAQRAIARAPYSAVWDELLINARTDTQLRERISPTFHRYTEAIQAAADSLPALAHLHKGQRRALLVVTLSLFGGEARYRNIHADEQLDHETLELMLELAQHLGIE
ncbi:TetR/AcrR family transcriptional regulator [Lolliginicoccus suaedae]|uniref:TetR/AcrR family transcriptional regulator n=1 Tax=Lolliginicoccus suaedae TaxID=2605429 RepID=UPI0016593D59|nr:TetR/AcrR family transcriptional regulator [Lolliginicoccus suaedae]